jgi:RNA polymerase sigma-70 factor (ECF subfamily)
VAPNDVEHSFAQLLGAHQLTLRQAIRRTCPRDLLRMADDIEQEARLRLWKALAAERILGNPKSYVYRVGVNATLDAIRRFRNRGEVELDADEDAPRVSVPRPVETPEARAERREVMASIEKCLSNLSDNRELAVRLYLQGFSSDQLAQLMDWTEAKARNLIYRGREDLRDCLRRRGIEYEAEG